MDTQQQLIEDLRQLCELRRKIGVCLNETNGYTHKDLSDCAIMTDDLINRKYNEIGSMGMTPYTYSQVSEYLANRFRG